jgi:hypothetical protein
MSRSALAGAFSSVTARYSLEDEPARCDTLGGYFFAGAEASMTVNVESRGRVNKLPFEAKAAGYTESVTITCFEPTRLPSAIRSGSDIIIDDLGVITVLRSVPSSLDVIVDVLGQEVQGYLARDTFTQTVTVEELQETVAYGGGVSRAWNIIGSYRVFVRTLDAEARARFMSAGYPEIDMEVSFRNDVTLELGKHRLVYMGMPLELMTPLQNLDERGAVRIARCKRLG